MEWIYLDNNATTPVAPEVMEEMLPYFSERFGNPSSLHQFGGSIREELDKARARVASLVSASRPNEIIFTSGGTESNNLAIQGAIKLNPEKRHIITTSVEHSSVLRQCKALEEEGFSITILPVNRQGSLDLEKLKNAITPNTALVSIMWANNETGVVFPIGQIEKICEAAGVLLHVDAVQMAGKWPIKLTHSPISFLSISSHKLHGPKGIGALYVKRGCNLRPLFFGGSQEKNFRSGTENVPGIIGFGKACELAQDYLCTRSSKIGSLKEKLENQLMSRFKFVKQNGAENKRICNTSSLIFEGLDAESIALLLSEEKIAVSTGSACQSRSLAASSVLVAMGLTPDQTKGAIRISLSRYTTEEEIDRFLEETNKIIQRLN